MPCIELKIQRVHQCSERCQTYRTSGPSGANKENRDPKANSLFSRFNATSFDTDARTCIFQGHVETTPCNILELDLEAKHFLGKETTFIWETYFTLVLTPSYKRHIDNPEGATLQELCCLIKSQYQIMYQMMGQTCGPPPPPIDTRGDAYPSDPSVTRSSDARGVIHHIDARGVAYPSDPSVTHFNDTSASYAYSSTRKPSMAANLRQLKYTVTPFQPKHHVHRDGRKGFHYLDLANLQLVGLRYHTSTQQLHPILRRVKS